ncbi:MAG: carbohydrate-binding protein [Bryobacteraceae bacterium]
MKRTSLLILCACLLLLASVPMAMGATCNTAWVSTTAYNGGATVSYNGVNYTAAYWTQGNEPDTNNGPSGSGEPWISNGSCSGGGGGGSTPTATKTPTATNGCTATAITPYLQVGSGSWQQTTSATVSSGSSLNLGPQPVSGGSWSWSGPNGYSSTARQIAITVSSTSTYTATYTNPCGSKSTSTFTITVTGSSCSPTSITPYIEVGSGSWSQTTSATVSSGSSVSLGPQPTSGGSWSWSGPNGYSSTSRQITVTVNSTSTYTATYTNSCGSKSTSTFTITVSGSSKTPTPCQSNCGGGGGKMFAPYMDISLGVGETVASMASQAGLHAITLAFLVDGGCTATWGGLGGTVSGAMFPNGTSVASAINALESQGVSVIISWGGAEGSIQSSCTSASSVQAMYQSVFNAYPGITGQDFDIEGGINTSVVASALKGLKSANSSKQISYTLPVMPYGLVAAGLSIAQAGFTPDTLNVMAMDYGSASDNGGQMGLDAEDAASATRSQTGFNIGITPMIGVNDTSTEVFQLSDASSLVSWANSNGYVNRLAFWSLARDNGGCAGGGYASATCSGVSQSNYQYSSIFNGF